MTYRVIGVRFKEFSIIVQNCGNSVLTIVLKGDCGVVRLCDFGEPSACVVSIRKRDAHIRGNRGHQAARAALVGKVKVARRWISHRNQAIRGIVGKLRRVTVPVGDRKHDRAQHCERGRAPLAGGGSGNHERITK